MTAYARIFLMLLIASTYFALDHTLVGSNSHPVYAAERTDPLPPPPNNNQNPKGGKDGTENDDETVLGQADESVPDPFNEKGPKVSKSLVDLHEEHKDRSEGDFNRAHTDIHRNEKPAEETDAYKRMDERRDRVDDKLKALDEEYGYRLKQASQDIDELSKELEGVKETPKNPKRKQEQEAVERVLSDKPGKLNKLEIEQLQKLRTLINWISRLGDIRTTLNEMMKLLEDTSSPYRRVSQGGENLPATCRVCKKSGLLGGVDCVTVQIEDGQC